MRAVLLALLAAALLAQNADAQRESSANFMVPMCRNFLDHRPTRTAFEEGVCVGIIEGLSHVRQALPPHLRWCHGPGVTAGQYVRVALAYIESRPQRMHEDFRQLAIEAWREAWPCGPS
jgi:hypothetical protein